MNPTVSTESAEHRFQQVLEDFFISGYDEKSLPSHGLYHHRRVWDYVKELINLPLFYEAGTKLADKLIIASYLHDMGMSLEKGLRHGRHSRDLCMKFLSTNNLNTDDYIDVLEAIENHDRKDYPENAIAGELLKILSLADDMDAFGFTGIYRYAEIYITRGMRPETIGYNIRENALKRFNNFEEAIGLNKEFLQRHKERYQLLDNFFNEYNIRASSWKFGAGDIKGYCGVIELIMKSFDEHLELIGFNASGEYPDDKVINWFFDGLKKEMV
jgi:hypothetical protein